MGLVKISICCLLDRIFIARWFKIGIRCAIALAVCWAIMTVLIGICICKPVARNWDTNIPGSCGNQNAAFSAVGYIDLLSDGLILVLPIPIVLQLQLPRANKIGLLAIFCGGILYVVSSSIPPFRPEKYLC